MKIFKTIAVAVLSLQNKVGVTQALKTEVTVDSRGELSDYKNDVSVKFDQVVSHKKKNNVINDKKELWEKASPNKPSRDRAKYFMEIVEDAKKEGILLDRKFLERFIPDGYNFALRINAQISKASFRRYFSSDPEYFLNSGINLIMTGNIKDAKDYFAHINFNMRKLKEDVPYKKEVGFLRDFIKECLNAEEEKESDKNIFRFIKDLLVGAATFPLRMVLKSAVTTLDWSVHPYIKNIFKLTAVVSLLSVTADVITEWRRKSLLKSEAILTSSHLAQGIMQVPNKINSISKIDEEILLKIMSFSKYSEADVKEGIDITNKIMMNKAKLASSTLAQGLTQNHNQGNHLPKINEDILLEIMSFSKYSEADVKKGIDRVDTINQERLASSTLAQGLTQNHNQGNHIPQINAEMLLEIRSFFKTSEADKEKIINNIDQDALNVNLDEKRFNLSAAEVDDLESDHSQENEIGDNINDSEPSNSPNPLNKTNSKNVKNSGQTSSSK